jgi:hypothetical protein
MRWHGDSHLQRGGKKASVGSAGALEVAVVLTAVWEAMLFMSEHR